MGEFGCELVHRFPVKKHIESAGRFGHSVSGRPVIDLARAFRYAMKGHLVKNNVVLVGANFRTWVSAVRHLYALLALGAGAPDAADAGTVCPRFGALYPKPSSLYANVDEYMVSVFEADRVIIEALLPQGMRAAASNTVGVSHYVVRGLSGRWDDRVG